MSKGNFLGMDGNWTSFKYGIKSDTTWILPIVEAVPGIANHASMKVQIATASTKTLTKGWVFLLGLKHEFIRSVLVHQNV